MGLFGHVLAKDYPEVDLRGAKVVLVESSDRLLHSFRPKSGARAQRTLSRRGVEVITGVGVDHLDAKSVHLANGRRIDAHTVGRERRGRGPRRSADPESARRRASPPPDWRAHQQPRQPGRPTSAFRYRDKGSMATIGRHEAVAEFANGLRLSGFIGWLSWLGLHIVSLMGFRNRANVLVNWTWNYFTYDRAARLVSADDEAARR